MLRVATQIWGIKINFFPVLGKNPPEEQNKTKQKTRKRARTVKKQKKYKWPLNA